MSRCYNILISHTSLFNKAGWGRIFPLAVGLQKVGNQVTILTTNPKFSFFTKRLVISGVVVIIFPEIIHSRISRLGFGFLSLILKIVYVINNRFDIVHSDNGHRPLSGIPCRLSKRLFGSVYIAEWYDWYGKGGQYDSKKKLFKWLFGAYEQRFEIRDKEIADGIVVLSEVLRNRALLFKNQNRIKLIHGGADVYHIPFIQDNSTVKQKYNISKDIITFGYISSDNYRMAEILPLLAVVSKNGLTSKVKFLFFGSATLPIFDLTADIKNSIICYGWVDYATDYEKLQCVDVFFLFKEEILGNRAGWPNCIGDYLACGRPVLLNPVGEIVEFANKYPNCFIESSLEYQDLSEKVDYIISNIDQVRSRYGDIRKLAEDVISWENKSKELFEFYQYIASLPKNVS